MGALSQQDVGSILEHYADVIEGGNAYAGGTVFRGIPGLHSNNRFLRDGTDDDFTVQAARTLSATTFDVPAANKWPQSRWVSDNAPPYFALCTTSGASGNPNLDRARKVTGWNNATKIFTVAPAFPSTPVVNDVMEMAEGFKRHPNSADIEDPETEIGGGYDRTFHLSAGPGVVIDVHGCGLITYEAILTVRIRMLKRARLLDWTRAAFANLAILRVALTKREHYPSGYVRALLAVEGASSTTQDDKEKIVVQDEYRLIYRIDGTLL